MGRPPIQEVYGQPVLAFDHAKELFNGKLEHWHSRYVEVEPQRFLPRAGLHHLQLRRRPQGHRLQGRLRSPDSTSGSSTSASNDRGLNDAVASAHRALLPAEPVPVRVAPGRGAQRQHHEPRRHGGGHRGAPHAAVDAYQELTNDKAVVSGHYYSDKAPLPALVVAPFWWLFDRLRLIGGGEHGLLTDGLLQFGGFVCGSVPLAVIITLIWLSLCRAKVDTRWRVALAMLPLYGSFLFVYSGSFFAHLPGACLLLLAMFAMKHERWSAAGAWCGAAVLCEYSLAVIPWSSWQALWCVGIGPEPSASLRGTAFPVDTARVQHGHHRTCDRTALRTRGQLHLHVAWIRVCPAFAGSVVRPNVQRIPRTVLLHARVAGPAPVEAVVHPFCP